VADFWAWKQGKLCGFGLRNRGPVLHFGDLRTGSAAGFLGSKKAPSQLVWGPKAETSLAGFAGRSEAEAG